LWAASPPLRTAPPRSDTPSRVSSKRFPGRRSSAISAARQFRGDCAPLPRAEPPVCDRADIGAADGWRRGHGRQRRRLGACVRVAAGLMHRVCLPFIIEACRFAFELPHRRLGHSRRIFRFHRSWRAGSGESTRPRCVFASTATRWSATGSRSGSRRSTRSAEFSVKGRGGGTPRRPNLCADPSARAPPRARLGRRARRLVGRSLGALLRHPGSSQSRARTARRPSRRPSRGRHRRRLTGIGPVRR
jgi:hypothetical protein